MDEAQDLIERYFENDLDDSELKEFELRLKEDSEFAKAFQVEKDLLEGIEFMSNQNLKKELNSIYKEEILEKKRTPKLKARRRFLVAAAAVAVLVISYLIIIPPDEPLTSAELYAEYNKPEFDFTERGSDAPLAARAQQLLQDKKYAPALPMLEELIEQNPQNNTMFILARGIALIEMGNISDGLSFINQVGILNPEAYQNEVYWYRGLTALKQNNLSESITELSKIPLESGRHKEAQKLISSIKKIMN